MTDPGKQSDLRTWVLVGDRGLYYVGLHESEDRVWAIALGWPHQDEINELKASGWYAAQAEIKWTKP